LVLLALDGLLLLHLIILILPIHHLVVDLGLSSNELLELLVDLLVILILRVHWKWFYQVTPCKIVVLCCRGRQSFLVKLSI